MGLNCHFPNQPIESISPHIPAGAVNTNCVSVHYGGSKPSTFPSTHELNWTFEVFITKPNRRLTRLQTKNNHKLLQGSESVLGTSFIVDTTPRHTETHTHTPSDTITHKSPQIEWPTRLPLLNWPCYSQLLKCRGSPGSPRPQGSCSTCSALLSPLNYCSGGNGGCQKI